MTLHDKVTVLDPFTHTEQENKKIMDIVYFQEKIMIDETLCTLVAVGGKFLEKETFKKVLKKIDEIRRISRAQIHTLTFKAYFCHSQPSVTSTLPSPPFSLLTQISKSKTLEYELFLTFLTVIT